MLGTSPGCGTASTEPAGTGATVVPVYSKETGRLAELHSDSDGDGKTDAWAFMDGRRLERIEIDRDADGTRDRFEYYQLVPPERARADSAGVQVEIERIEEAEGPGDRITRREFYEHGELSRAEEDSDGDGRVDRWEYYRAGVLTRVELDAAGLGTPTRRSHYRSDRTIERIEIDPEGAGQWRPAPPGA